MVGPKEPQHPARFFHFLLEAYMGTHMHRVSFQDVEIVAEKAFARNDSTCSSALGASFVTACDAQTAVLLGRSAIA